MYWLRSTLLLLLLLLLLQVTVKSLAEAGKASLLNKNITVVKPAPPAVQAEASGQQYVRTEGK
jgi:hypothetical protein